MISKKRSLYFLTVTVFSANKNSLHFFLLMLIRAPFIKPQIRIKFKKFKKSLVSILTSPHVNKTAQEHFHREKNAAVLKIKCSDLEKLLYFFKKINYSIADVGIKIKLSHFSQKKSHAKRIKINPDEVSINVMANVPRYIELLDSYGDSQTEHL